ncbi:MAG TPA: thioesterase family protein [Pseudomonadota bacterium]|nr:thioesterase family protein [Pseudomonadota bacterium]
MKNEMTAAEPGLGRWPVRIELPVAWGEMDAFAHVNNTVYLRWFESARIAYFDKAGFATGGIKGLGPILARTTIDYRVPLTYPDSVTVETTVLKLGRSSFVMGYRATSRKLSAVAAEGESVLVMFDYSRGIKVELDAETRRRMLELESSF